MAETGPNQTQFPDSQFAVFNTADPTKQVVHDLSGAVTGKTLTLQGTQTEDRTLAYPNKDGILETLNAERSALAALSIDYASDEIKTKTLSGVSTLTITNPVQGKVVVLEVVPAGFTLTLPGSVKVIAGRFRTGVTNYLYFHCIDSATPTYLATINQGI